MNAADYAKSNSTEKTDPVVPEAPKSRSIEDLEKIITACVHIGNAMGYGIRVMGGETHITPNQITPDPEAQAEAEAALADLLG